MQKPITSQPEIGFGYKTGYMKIRSNRFDVLDNSITKIKVVFGF